MTLCHPSFAGEKSSRLHELEERTGLDKDRLHYHRTGGFRVLLDMLSACVTHYQQWGTSMLMPGKVKAGPLDGCFQHGSWLIWAIVTHFHPKQLWPELCDSNDNFTSLHDTVIGLWKSQTWFQSEVCTFVGAGLEAGLRCVPLPCPSHYTDARLVAYDVLKTKHESAEANVPRPTLHNRDELGEGLAKLFVEDLERMKMPAFMLCRQAGRTRASYEIKAGIWRSSSSVDRFSILVSEDHLRAWIPFKDRVSMAKIKKHARRNERRVLFRKPSGNIIYTLEELGALKARIARREQSRHEELVRDVSNLPGATTTRTGPDTAFTVLPMESAAAIQEFIRNNVALG